MAETNSETTTETAPEAVEQQQQEQAAKPKSLLAEMADHLPEAAELLEEAEAKAKAEAEKKSDDDPTKKPDAKKDEPAKKPVNADEVQQRIDKATRLQREAEERATAAEAELKRLKEGGAPKSEKSEQAADPLADITTPEELDERVALAKRVIAKAKAFFRHGTPVKMKKDDGSEEELDSATIEAMEDEAHAVLEMAPGRAAFLQSKATKAASTRTDFPEYFQDGTDEAKRFASMQRAFPEIGRMFEDSEDATIALILGFQALAERRGKKGEKKDDPAAKKADEDPDKKPAKPPVAKLDVPLAPPNPGASTASRVKVSDAKREAAHKEFMESDGSEEALRRYYEAIGA